MKITRVDQFAPRNRTRLVRISTDTGIEGWGETTLEGKPRSVPAAIDEMTDYLIGKDPLRIEHHWQQIYRSAFFRGGPHNMTALAGINAALWDIAGKHFSVPSYMLMGGNVRDRIRVYAHWGIQDLSDEGLQRSRDRLDHLQTMGYTAYKAGAPGLWRAHEPPSRIDEFVKMAYMMREWVGDDVELCFDFHAKMTPGLAIEVCHELKGMRPMFVEEPVPQENPDALKLVADKVPFPIATGERLLSRWEFREIIEKQAVSLLQPDVAHCGGPSELQRIANYAEIYYQHIMPHCAIGPLALAACMLVDATVPNFLIQEQVDASLGNGLLKKDWEVVDGHIALWDTPGLGVEIDEAEATKEYDGPAYGYHEELGGETYHENDGSVADW
ncbi:MAG: galactonate dehydratase [Chloroflexi bacterium]|nr:galactonate dehydratase [Chloroflexota bacterium]